MLVKELIKRLEELDPELPVIYINIGSGHADGPVLVTTVAETVCEKQNVIVLDGEGFL